MPRDNLSTAKNAKADEFYTTKTIIEEELGKNLSYRKNFEGKTVIMNCDDPEWSEFWKFFVRYFHVFKLKKIISTHFNMDGSPSYKLEWDGSMIGGITVNMIKTPLKGNGDFKSPECIALLDESDIAVTNPPFSKFRSYLKLLIDHKKQFVILGNINAVTYKEVFPLIRDNKMWAGYSFNKTMDFIIPDSYEITGKGYIDDSGKKHGFVPAIAWYTNLNIAKRHEDLDLNKRYIADDYPQYDNYNAIEVGRVENIPNDYYETMGVPITFLDKYNPDQFEIVGLGTSTEHITHSKIYEELKTHKPDGKIKNGAPINSTLAIKLQSVPSKGEYYTDKNGYIYIQPYARILIRRKIDGNHREEN